MTCNELADALTKKVESLEAQLHLAHVMHDVAAKERDYERLRANRMEEERNVAIRSETQVRIELGSKLADSNRLWLKCHDGSENACCKNHDED